MAFYADAKRESVPISERRFTCRTTTSTEAKQCAKVHITLILESEILKPSNNQTIEYYQEVLTQINKL